MPDVATLATAQSTGHDNCPEVMPKDAGQSILTVNGSPVLVVGATYETHGYDCPDHGPHDPVVSEGSSILTVNGIPVSFVGCKIAEGGCTPDHQIAQGDSKMTVSG